MALVYLFASDDADVVGIASTAGNVPVQQVCRNNLGLLELCQLTGVPVSKGSEQPVSTPLRTAEDTHGPEGLGYARLPSTDRQLTAHDAAEAWVRAAHAYPGELVAIATGPLTNLALALRIEPALPKLLRRLVIMGGAFDYRGNTTPVAEWNISVDPEAAAEVFAVWGAAWGLRTAEAHPNRVGAQPDRERRDDADHLEPARDCRGIVVDSDERARRPRYAVGGVQPADPRARGRDAVLLRVPLRPGSRATSRICTTRWPPPSHWIPIWCSAGPPRSTSS